MNRLVRPGRKIQPTGKEASDLLYPPNPDDLPQPLSNVVLSQMHTHHTHFCLSRTFKKGCGVEDASTGLLFPVIRELSFFAAAAAAAAAAAYGLLTDGRDCPDMCAWRVGFEVCVYCV